MSVLVIAAIGVGIVLVSILALKLHPLVALLLGSLFLLAATPQPIRLQHQLSDHYVDVVQQQADFVGLQRTVDDGYYQAGQPGTLWSATALCHLRRAGQEELSTAGLRGETGNLVWYRVAGAGGNRLTQASSLIAIDALRTANLSPLFGLGSQLAEGFARTFRKLGIPVTMAAIIGICLLESGAAARLVESIVGLFGRRGTSPALTVSGFVLGVPVYFDNVFYLLLPLAKAVGRQRPEMYLSAVMAIIVGATMAHSLVPPTPGPLLVAAEMGVSVGKMMLGGFLVGSLAASVGYAYGAWCTRWMKLAPPTTDPKEAATQQLQRKRPIPLWLAALPIALPILILGGSEIVEFLASNNSDSAWLQVWRTRLGLIDDPNLIFIVTAVFSIMLLRYYTDQPHVGRSVSRGLTDAGTIVLLTCAGGAFGASLQQLGLATAIGERFSGLTTPWGMLATAFFLTTIIRAAQGSATVAMITSAAIVAPVMHSVSLPFDPIYVALAIGCGSKPLPWMNDSGFWQVATMTGMSTSQTLKTFTVALSLMGLTGFAVTLLGAWLFPLV